MIISYLTIEDLSCTSEVNYKGLTMIPTTVTATLENSTANTTATMIVTDTETTTSATITATPTATGTTGSKSATNSPRIARITINRSTQTNFLVTNPHLLGNDYLDNRSIASNSSSTNTLNAIGLQGFMGMGNICDSTTSSDSHGDTMSLEQLLLAVQEETDIHIYNIYI